MRGKISKIDLIKNIAIFQKDIANDWKGISQGHISVRRIDRYKEPIHAGMPLFDLVRMLQRSSLVGAMGSSSEISSSRTVFEGDDVPFVPIRLYLRKVALVLCNGEINVPVRFIWPIEARFRAMLVVLLSSINSVCWADWHNASAKVPETKWKRFSEMPIILLDINTLLEPDIGDVA